VSRRALAAAGAGGALLISATMAVVIFVLPGPTHTGPVVLGIAEGERFASIADQLARLGVVRSALGLRVLARVTGRDRDVAWGDYLLEPPLSPWAVLERLARPPDPLGQVTIPEGLTVDETVDLLVAHGHGTRDAFEVVLRDPAFLTRAALPATGAEGYLFPDTYVFPSTLTPERIVQLMLARFRTQLDGALLARGRARGLSPHQLVTLASLVEEETTLAAEQRLVSAVFHNRLRLGMRLQSDPTVLYGRPPGDRRITRADLQRPTPYNTYVIDGLPPGPIANPGRGALEAAADPADTDALYFVARGDGSHEFTATLPAHNAAVARYRR
jgi:UPF0755 protein